MAYFAVKSDVLQADVSQLTQIARNMDRLEAEMLSVSHALSFRMKSSEQIRRAIQKNAQEISRQSHTVGQMGRGLLTIADQYRRTENSVKEHYGKKSFGIMDIIAAWIDPSRFIILGPGGKPQIYRPTKLNHVIFSAKTDDSQIASGTVGVTIGATSSAMIGKAAFNTTKGDVYAEAGVKSSFNGIKASASGKYGIASGSASVSAINVDKQASVKASLVKDGKLEPTISANAAIAESLVSGEVAGTLGTEDLNAYAKAKGDLVGGAASASVGVGKITDYKDRVGYGVKGELKGEVYAAKGEVSGGINLFGVKIGGKVTGKAGALGGTIGGTATTSGVSGKIGASAVLGVEVELDVDWSEAKLPDFKLPDWKKWW